LNMQSLEEEPEETKSALDMTETIT
jgi:hypothetical protein